MEPVFPTRQALHELCSQRGDDLERELRAMAADVVRLAPSCLGMSLTLASDMLTFTLLADPHPARARDRAAAPADPGCTDPLDEAWWRTRALEDAATGVASSVSFHVVCDDTVLAEVTLYGAESETFAGRYDDLALVCGGCPGDTVTDADLSMRTLADAAGTPARLEAIAVVDRATGFVAASQHISTEVARRRLADAARLTGVTEAELARAILGSGRD